MNKKRNRIRNYFRKQLLSWGFSQEKMESIYIYCYKIVKKIKNPWYKLKNFLLLYFRKRSQLEFSLLQRLLSNDQDFGDNQFYQSYPPLGFSGERDTQLRFENYKIKNYISKESIVLDIGGNVGFFSLFLSQEVSWIDVIEYNPHLVEIGNRVQKYQHITNVSITQMNFHDFTPNKQYDLILSFAVHKWIGLPFHTYLEKIASFLKPNGIIFIESQNLDIDPEFETNINRISDIFEIISISDTGEKSGYQRKIAVLKRKT